MEPANSIIEKCGGFSAVAEMVGRSEIQVRKWTYPKEKGGTGGLVPTNCQSTLLEAATAQGKCLAPEDFFRKAS